MIVDYLIEMDFTVLKLILDQLFNSSNLNMKIVDLNLGDFNSITTNFEKFIDFGLNCC